MRNRINAACWPSVALLGALAVGGCSNPGPSQGGPTARVADAALEAGYPQMALTVADNILARDPRNVPALVARGDALINSGRTDDAAAAYRQALAVQPGNAGANLGLGRIMVRRDPPQAERLFRTALASRPDDPVLLANLGVALDLQERHAEAQTAYRRSLQMAPDAAATKANLGLSLALSGDRAGAQQVLGPLAADASAAQVVRDNMAVTQMHAIAPAGRAPAGGASAGGASAGGMPAAAASAAAAPPGGMAGAYVQLAVADSREAAETGWQRESRRNGGLLADHSPQIAEAVVNGRTIWRLRVPVSSSADGRRLCAELEAKGTRCSTIAPGS